VLNPTALVQTDQFLDDVRMAGKDADRVEGLNKWFAGINFK
jgi:hypothetical protein